MEARNAIKKCIKHRRKEEKESREKGEMEISAEIEARNVCQKIFPTSQFQ